jgi:beta-lactamase superfamily II metal-dependent hydrolase
VKARLVAGLVFLCTAFAPGAWCVSPTPGIAPTPAAGTYRDAYLLERSAAALSLSGDSAGALPKYLSAAAIYESLLAAAPEANRPGLAVRLQECRSRIEAIEKARAEEKAARHPLRVHFIDVGQGDSALVQCPDGSAILIDGGPIDCYPFLISYLKKVGVERIDLIIATHPDGDHIGGLINVLKRFPVGMVVDSGKAHTTVTYQKFLEAIRSSPKTIYKQGRAGDRFAFGAAEIRLFHPGASLPKDNNNASVVCRLACRDIIVLFAGDVGEKVENEMMKRGGIGKVTVLKVAHHGSRASSSARFLSSVSPRLAVISVGEWNSFGHPHPDTLKRLREAGAEVLRTDERGTIVLSCDGRSIAREFPGRAFNPEYETPPEKAGLIIADRVMLIYHLPGDKNSRYIPPEEREYFRTEAEAESAGYVKSWL